MKKKIRIKIKSLVIIEIVLLIILLCFIYSIIRINIKQNHFNAKNEQIINNNKDDVFKIEKITICSSANAIDKSSQKDLKDLLIYQYSDIAIYINNGDELTNRNTIKELYVDNIQLENDGNKGTKFIKYKNLLKFGSKEEIANADEQEQKIDFNIIYTNEENEKANYDEATFFTDCSNPISLEYVNYNIAENFTMQENNSISFDGSVLEKANISIKDISCKLKFKINLITNSNEKYSCYVNFKLPLNDIYNGTTMKSKTTQGKEYIFFRHI